MAGNGKEDVDFLEDLLRKSTYFETFDDLKDFDFTTGPVFDDIPSPAGTPVEYEFLPWDQPYDRTMSVQPTGPVEQLASGIIERYFDVGPISTAATPTDMRRFEGDLVGALERNRQYQTEIRALLADLEKASVDVKTARNQLVGVQKRLWSAQRARVLKPMGGSVAGKIREACSISASIDTDKSNLKDASLARNVSMMEAYREGVLAKSPKWSSKETGALVEGVRQANLRLLLAQILQQFSGEVATQKVKELHAIPPGDLEFNLEGIDWNYVASAALGGKRSAVECQIQWTVHQHPLINESPGWPADELARLDALVQQHGTQGRWQQIAEELGTNRPAYACLVTYQRRRKDLLKGRWAAEEDAKLLRLHAAHQNDDGGRDWVRIVGQLGGARTVVQCVHRYYKTLDPSIKRGRWTLAEDGLLSLGVAIHGSKDWFLVCRWVPGRTDVQCRERWMNVRNPDLLAHPFDAAEDERLLRAVEAGGGPGQWASIQQKLFPGRTDSQLRRRWKQLTDENAPKKRPTPKPGAKAEAEAPPKRKRGRPRKQ